MIIIRSSGMYAAGDGVEWCPSGAFAEGENEVSESIETSNATAPRGEPLRTASGGKVVRGEVNRKGVSSPVGSHDH